MSEIVLVYQPYVPATLQAAQAVGRYLEQRGRCYRYWSAHELPAEVPLLAQLAICFGGDGTALRAARWLSSAKVPVLPVRMGKLSFLGEISPTDLPGGLQPYLEGDFWLDERSMLSVVHAERRFLGLNDAALVRGESPRAMEVTVEVDGARVATYLADGVVVSSPTGSTAYSLAAGGPVLAPTLRAMVVTPIAPHLSALRSLVVPGDARITLRRKGYTPGILTVDGQSDVAVQSGEAVCISLADETSLFARRGNRGAFYQDLADKLQRG